MDLNAKGQRVVVTAGAAGIGRAIAELLAANGANVMICDIDHAAVQQIERDCPAIQATVADVTDEDAITAFINDAAIKLGGLDALVNNAGISGPTLPVEDIEYRDWMSVLDVNLSGLFLATRTAVPHLKRNGGGTILNISSVSGRLGVPLRTPYAATKWGVLGITQSLAKELGPFGIRVNAILPGFIEGQRIERVIAARARSLGLSVENMQRQYLEKVSLRRFVAAEDVAAQALFLISSAGRSISGQSIGICGNVEYL